MKLLIPWSGGLDSTALIYRRLKEGHEVTAVRFALENNEKQTAGERLAVENLSHWLKQEADDKFSFNHAMTPFVTVHLFGGSFVQPVLWSSFLGIAASVLGDFDAIEMAYVLNDDACSYLPEISRQIRNSYAICARPSNKRKLRISFPLVKFTKRELWNSLPNGLRYLIHFCEFSDKPCGQCPSCKRFEREIMSVYDFMLQREDFKSQFKTSKLDKAIEEVDYKDPNVGDYAELPLKMPALPERGTAAERNEPDDDGPNLQR